MRSDPISRNVPRMRRLRITARLAATLRAEFGKAARERLGFLYSKLWSDHAYRAPLPLMDQHANSRSHDSHGDVLQDAGRGSERARIIRPSVPCLCRPQADATASAPTTCSSAMTPMTRCGCPAPACQSVERKLPGIVRGRPGHTPATTREIRRGIYSIISENILTREGALR